MAGWFAEEGLVSDSAPVVAAEKNAGDPHYLPTAAHNEDDRDVTRCCLLDLWAKPDHPGAVFADITWVGIPRREVPARIAVAFKRGERRARRGGRARPAADLAPAKRSAAARSTARRWPCCASAGLRRRHPAPHGAQLSARRCTATASTWTTIETHDDRRLLTGTGFTIEPGVYFDRLRRPLGNQHDRGRPGRHGHRAAADRDNALL